MYSKAGFNDKAKFGLLQKIAIKVPDIAPCAIYRGETDYSGIKQVVLDFEKGKKAYQFASSQVTT